MPTLPTIFPFPIFRPLGTNGQLLPGGWLYSYHSGTSTPLATYNEVGAANPNPIQLNSAGQAYVRLGAQAYRLHLTDANFVPVVGWPVDNISFAPVWPYATDVVAAEDNAPELLTDPILVAGSATLVVTTKIIQAFGTSRGLTGFAIGDGVILDRWGIQTSLALGALSGGGDAPPAAMARDGSMPRYVTSQRVHLTAIGGKFDGAGQVEVSAQFLAFRHTM